MCGLCSDDALEVASARTTATFNAERLETLAAAYRQMASGDLKPHGDNAKKVGIVARSIVRQLVEEWV